MAQYKGPLAGEAAYEHMCARYLWKSEPTARLARKVVDFYGDRFNYVENRELENSRYFNVIEHEPVSFTSVRIELKITGKREVAALAHELLHLQQAILGFPIADRFFVPDELDRHAEMFAEMQQSVGNVVAHEIMIGRFLELGLSRRIFLGSVSKGRDYRDFVLNSSPDEKYMPEVGFSWFCMEWLRHWITHRHIEDAGCARLAESAVEWGSTLEPELRDATERIAHWVERGTFKDPAMYATEYNALMEMMRLPKYTRWVLLTDGKPGPPQATTFE